MPADSTQPTKLLDYKYSTAIKQIYVYSKICKMSLKRNLKIKTRGKFHLTELIVFETRFGYSEIRIIGVTVNKDFIER